MKLLFWSLIGGLAGTALMDIAGIYNTHARLNSDYDLLTVTIHNNKNLSFIDY